MDSVRYWSYDETSNSGSYKYYRNMDKTVNSSPDENKLVRTVTTGSGNAHNNIPPARAAYVWRRTA